MKLINHSGDKVMRKSGRCEKWTAKVGFTDLCAVMAAGLAAAACLRRGLFFSEDWYPILTVWFLLCGAAAASRLQGDAQRQSGGFGYTGRARKAERGLSGDSERAEGGKAAGKGNLAQTVMLGGPMMMAGLYAAAWLKGPLSAQGTMNELLRWSGYGSFALLAWTAASRANAGRLLWTAWHAAGMLLCLSGLMSFYGALLIPYAVLYSVSPEVSASGARLGGLLQYPNAFGAVMAVFLLERLFAVAQSYAGLRPGGKREHGGGTGSSCRDREQGGGANGGPGRMRKGSGCVTGSSGGKEGGCATGSGGDRAGGCVSSGKRWGRKLALRVVGRRASANRPLRGDLLRLSPLFPYTAALLLSESRGAWLAAACACAAALPLQRRLALPLLAAGAAPLAAAALLCRGLPAPPAAPLPGLLLLAGLWAGALAAGLWLGRRAQHAAGRGRAAALALAALGWTAGGAAVLTLARARGTGPSSTVAARGLMYRDALRFAAEAPWLGRGGETWRSAYLAVQSRPYVGSQVHSGYLDLLLNVGGVGVAAAAICLAAAGWLIRAHSRRLLPPFLVLILHGAVDFDWSYGLFWLLLFWLPALARAEAVRAGSLYGQHPSSWKLPAAGVCCLLLALSLLSFRACRGEALYRAAASARQTPEAAALLERSLAWNPLSPKSALALSSLLNPERRTRILMSGLRYSPMNPTLNWAMAEAVSEQGPPGEALYWLRRSQQLDVFNYVKRTESVKLMLAMGKRYLAEGYGEEALRCAEAGRELLKEYFWLAAETGETPLHNDRRFRFTAEARTLNERLEALKREASGLAGQRREAEDYALKRR
ncbi:hypothetical protein J2Z22_003133 [Paenibacillus forsythiae]|uniref:O-antigen ligase-related domain-containing protein n=2 Tax=Paenibacillus forsythiae TaxID=365616 RepID=A0ABU3H9S4_9BACL|nr:O-antigen ligase family protein [Paenibacillus forsythiae]MDT3427570.1 hypothetical protein [Paenibacillus forsythiae]